MRPTLRRLALSLSLLLGAGLGPWALATAQEPSRVVEGQAFALHAKVGGTELRLNGTGVRAVAWFKGYAAGLYLPQRSTTLAQVLAARGPKRLELRMLQEVPAAEFVKALNKGIERNTPAAQMAALQTPMQGFAQLIEQIGKVRRGDVIQLDLDPARGLLFSVNGTLRGDVAAGHELYDALLRAFMGAQPYDEKMKAGLLAGSAG